MQGFGCVEDATLKLTRLHALIGPNDSGKTTLLRAVRTGVQLFSAGFEEPPTPNGQRLHPFDPGVGPSDPFSVQLTIAGPSNRIIDYKAENTQPRHLLNETFCLNSREINSINRSSWSGSSPLWDLSPKELSDFSDLLERPAQWLHLNAGAMRKDSKLFAESESKLLDLAGSRLPAIYDAILNRGDDTFLRIAEEVRRFFPPIKNIRLKNVARDTKAFEIELISGQRVPASFISDGVLYFLAFAALEHTAPASILLIEEPENGLHPSRIADVMRVLRRLSERVQIVLATHSPFVINEFQGNEVTVVTRPEGKGTQVRRLCDTPNFEERSKVYALGELWISYADGKDEHALLSTSDAAE